MKNKSLLTFATTIYILLSVIFLPESAFAQKFEKYHSFSAGKYAYPITETAIFNKNNDTLTFVGNSKGYIILYVNNNYDKVLKQNNKSVIGHTNAVNAFAVHQTEPYLASVGEDGKLIVWNLQSKKGLKQFKSKASRVAQKAELYFVAFANDGSLLYGGSTGKLQRINPFEKDAKAEILATYDQPITSAAYNLHDNTIAIGVKESVKIFDLTTGREKRVLGACGQQVIDISWSADGNHLSSLCNNGTVTIWHDINNKIDSMKTTKSHQESISTEGMPMDIGLSPDGKYLALACKDHQIRIWDSENKYWLEALTGHLGSVRSVKFSADGKTIVSGSDDKQASIWRWPKINNIDLVAASPKKKIVEKKTVKIYEWIEDNLKKDVQDTVKIAKNESKKEVIKIKKPIPTPKPKAKPSPKKVQPKVVAKVKTIPFKTDKNVTKKRTNTKELQGFILTYKDNMEPDSIGDRGVKALKTSQVKSDELELQVWDDQYEDGDTISLFLNGKWILTEHPLTRQKQEVKVSINKTGDNFLLLYAHNEGTRPPNTIALTIFDGNKKRKLTLKSTMLNCETVNLKYYGK